MKWKGQAFWGTGISEQGGGFTVKTSCRSVSAGKRLIFQKEIDRCEICWTGLFPASGPCSWDRGKALSSTLGGYKPAKIAPDFLKSLGRSNKWFSI